MHFIALGKENTNKVRDRLIELFSKDSHELQQKRELHPLVFYKQDHGDNDVAHQDR